MSSTTFGSHAPCTAAVLTAASTASCATNGCRDNSADNVAARGSKRGRDGLGPQARGTKPRANRRVLCHYYGARVGVCPCTFHCLDEGAGGCPHGVVVPTVCKDFFYNFMRRDCTARKYVTKPDSLRLEGCLLAGMRLQRVGANSGRKQIRVLPNHLTPGDVGAAGYPGCYVCVHVHRGAGEPRDDADSILRRFGLSWEVVEAERHRVQLEMTARRHLGRKGPSRGTRPSTETGARCEAASAWVPARLEEEDDTDDPSFLPTPESGAAPCVSADDWYACLLALPLVPPTRDGCSDSDSEHCLAAASCSPALAWHGDYLL